MKGAFDEYLKGGEANKPMAAGPSDDEMDSMFGDSEEGEDPLMEALQSAGYAVDPAKLDKIRGILESKEGEPTSLAGEETPAEEALEPGGAGMLPMKAGKPSL